MISDDQNRDVPIQQTESEQKRPRSGAPFLNQAIRKIVKAAEREGRFGSAPISAGDESAPRELSIDRKELARRLGCNVRTIAKLEDEGLPVFQRGRGGRPSRYRFDDVKAWDDERKAAELKAVSTDDVTLLTPRQRKELAQALEAEQRVAIKAGKFVEVDDVEKMWSAEVTAVRSIILASYLTHSDRIFRVATLEGVAGVEREMKALGEGICRELAREDRPMAQVNEERAEAEAFAQDRVAAILSDEHDDDNHVDDDTQTPELQEEE